MFLPFLALLTVPISQTPKGLEAPRENVFALECEVLSALEEGPLVLKVTLQYSGKTPIDLHEYAASSEARIKVPDTWIRVHRLRAFLFFGNPDGGIRHMEPGDRWTEMHYLHHDYDRLPPGNARLRIEWPIRDYHSEIETPKKQSLGIIQRNRSP